MSSTNVPTMLPPVHGNVYPPQQAFNDNALLQQLKNQIEFYFCPQNLANDPYLLSHLHSTEHIGAVPIQVLCHFPKVRQLYCLARFGQHVPVEMAPAADPVFVGVALRGSSVVVNISDDGMWVMPLVIPEPQPWIPNEAELAKETASSTVVTTTTEATAPASPSSQTTGSSSVGVPTHPLPLKERNTVMLRDIPASATEEAILAVFSSEHGTPKSARPDIGNTWYVTFESEEQAFAALAASREKTIDGAPISGHLTSERSGIKEPRPTPPPIPPLPPAAPQNQMQTGAPLPPPNQTPYYSMQPVMAQQPYGYGYVPYGYAVPQQHYGYPVQQRFQYGGGYVRAPQQHLPQHSGIRPDNTSAPPSNVFVRPNHNHNEHQHRNHNNSNNEHQHGNHNHNNSNNTGNTSKKKRSNRNKNRNNKNQKHNNSERPSPDNPVDNRQQQQQQPDQEQSGGKANGHVPLVQHAQNNDAKKHWKNRGKKSFNKKQEENIDMGVEHFPALGGSKNSPRPSQSIPQSKPAYAEALLKRKTPQPAPQPSSGEPSFGKPIDTGLEAAMNSLAFSEAGAASYDEW
eukprot:CAMPEP_0117044188 /NCGR_PEP_ID=MMETSP0472-20121206/30652_1 /TAXON_ID=693140 ORGANISM="Tiarina fusus, Strain LIS" /NCGR_SAMPLE_ID=MMETSP0472 /ASSEMBLY_ACC=CAM_ASM_000603 /LENGTH=570 /DNA_ID=CAMNT_0004755875 /DNA_START=223 /DNA_END=1936 /DNA_ORIENTATION=-